MIKKRYGNNAKKMRMDVLVAQSAVSSQNFFMEGTRKTTKTSDRATGVRAIILIRGQC